MVQAFFPDGANPALRDGVGSGRLEGSQDDFKTLRDEDVVEAGREFGIMVMDEESPFHRFVAKFPH